mmetsp:Transcript_2317/g.3958  ORF Transcript_2317/g.3958 Transcript_2317/m.3958 type:complete len:261 (-) Transcript_2317:84-866(-)
MALMRLIVTTSMGIISMLWCPVVSTGDTSKTLQCAEDDGVRLLQVGSGGGGSAMQVQPNSGWPFWGDMFTSLDDIYFVEIGANNGLNEGSVQGDPIYDYATKYQWQGYVIEPNPNSFKELQENYVHLSGVTPLNFAVSDQDEMVTLHFGPGDASANEAATILENTDFANSTQVPALSLQSLWEKHVANKVPRVDILVVDVEGAEPKVLKGSLATPKPRFILFEYYHLSEADHIAICTNLEEQGYRKKGMSAADELHELVV